MICNLLISQIELSSSWKKVGIVTKDEFETQRDAAEPERPHTTSEVEPVPPSEPVPAVPSSHLSPNAEVFRPRAYTAPVSRSLPTSVPESPQYLQHVRRQGSRTPKRRDAEVAPRFFPILPKETSDEKVGNPECLMMFISM